MHSISFQTFFVQAGEFQKRQSGCEDTLEERCAIKFCFKLEKMPQNRMKYFRLLLEHLAWSEHQFLSGIRDSSMAGSLWGMIRGVRGVRMSIHQSWLDKELGIGLLYWGFKGVHEEIPSEEASTLQIGSVAFLARQRTSPQLHPCHSKSKMFKTYLYCTPKGIKLLQPLSQFNRIPSLNKNTYKESIILKIVEFS